MTLLREIQNSAIDSDIDLSTLLRKCKVLATRLGNPEFKDWVEHELNGYNNTEDLPNYRRINVHSQGIFINKFGTDGLMKNANIPSLSIPENYRHFITKAYISSSINAIESLLKDAINESILHENWDPNLIGAISTEIYTNMICRQAWKIIPKSEYGNILNAVRNKILDFCLEIEAENPNAGEADINTIPIPQEKVSQIFNTYITDSNIQNMATGNHQVDQSITHSNNDELFSKLLIAVKKAQIEKNVLTEISEKIEDMKISQNTPSFKANFQNFIDQTSKYSTILSAIGPYIPALTKLIP